MNKAILALGLMFMAPSLAKASNYPPDYPLVTDCSYDGPVKACRNIGGNWVSLSIEYTGKLVESMRAGDELLVWVKLNGNEGNFPMKLYSYYTKYARATISQSAHSCRSNRHGSYECDKPTEDMKHVLFWARPDSGYPIASNAWQVELAFVNTRTGEWDNNGSEYGSYAVSFWQR